MRALLSDNPSEAVEGPESVVTAWHLVLNRDGVVLAAADGAPAVWVGTRLIDRVDVPEDVKAAARTVLGRSRDTASPASGAVALESLKQTVHLTVVDALPLRRMPTNLRALLESALHALKQQAKAADVGLTIDVADAVPPRILIDDDKIAWVTSVLVGNSLRYVRRGSHTMPGGSIAVRASYEPTTRDIVIEVQDDGPGIPEKTLPSLFRAAPDQARVGLALLMVGEVVAAHGGRVQAASDTTTFSNGTKIRLTLPAA